MRASCVPSARRSAPPSNAARCWSASKLPRRASNEHPAPPGRDPRGRPARRFPDRAEELCARRSRGAGRSAGRERPRADPGRVLRQPEARAADGRCGSTFCRDPQARRHTLHRAVAQRSRLRPGARRAAGRSDGHAALLRVRCLQPPEQRPRRGADGAGAEELGAALPRGRAADRSRLPDDSLRLQPAGRDQRGDARRCAARHRHAAARRRPGAAQALPRRHRGLGQSAGGAPARGPGALAAAGRACRPAPARHAGLGDRQRLRRAGDRRRPVRRLGRGARWLPVQRPRPRQRRRQRLHRGPGVPVPRARHRDRHRPGGAARRRAAGRTHHRPAAGRQADARRNARGVARTMNTAAIAAARVGLAELFRERVRSQPDAPALSDGRVTLSYAELSARVQRLAAGLQAAGVRAGERIAVLSENRLEYLELELAAATLGVIVACLNWRLAADEQRHCIRLVEPQLIFVSPRHAPALAAIDHGAPRVLGFGDDYERLCHDARVPEACPDPDPETGLVILYTSGTTGLPKGALISQRAMVARAAVFAADYGIGRAHSYIAWSPLFHMAATDHALATLLLGGQVHLSDGLDLERIAAVLQSERVGWLMAMPGVIDGLIDALRPLAGRLIAPRMVGAMADLLPRQQIAELTRLLDAPYLNSFGSTETGLPPASGALLAPGVVPASLSKRISSLCRVRLVDAEDREVGIDQPGEMTLRAPTLFSGYWNAAAANAHDFRGGWFHLGDMFVRHADGTLDFVDRLKYLIKSGGENIYPAEIERVLLAHPAVADGAVVRRPDARWGEVPVAFVALRSALPDGELDAWCRERLAHYKVPQEFRIVELEALPRSSTGKIQRHEIERRML